MNSDSPNTNLPTKVNCPTCKKSVVWNEQSHYRPFCSQRCQQIDFGEWASENYSIPGASNNQGRQEYGDQGYAENEFDDTNNLGPGSVKH